MENIFNFTKLRPLIKLNTYKYIGCNDNYPNINYYIRKFDEHDNYEFMEAKIGKLPRLFKKYVMVAGTSIKTLDSFMTYYLRHRKDKTKGKEAKIEAALEEAGYEAKRFMKFYSNDANKEIKKTDYYKNKIKEGYKVLYCMDNENPDIKFSRAYLVMVKEDTFEDNMSNKEVGYVCFSCCDFVTKPSYVKGESKEKYRVFELPNLNIPTSILK